MWQLHGTTSPGLPTHLPTHIIKVWAPVRAQPLRPFPSEGPREAKGGTLPDRFAVDRVVIYRNPILRACETEAQVAHEIRDTLIHELGHHMGLSDEEMPY